MLLGTVCIVASWVSFGAFDFVGLFCGCFAYVFLSLFVVLLLGTVCIVASWVSFGAFDFVGLFCGWFAYVFLSLFVVCGGWICLCFLVF